MRCKDIERLIIDSTWKDLNREELLFIKEHTQQCPQCTLFQSEYKNLRLSLKNNPAPALPEDLDRSTCEMCRKALNLQKKSAPTIPLFIWGVLAILIVISVIMFVPVFKDLRLNEPLSSQALFVLTFLIQNTVMLFFTPILIKNCRAKKQGLNIFS
jgi:predicted nucleic acid-binding Zn ribbon protein